MTHASGSGGRVLVSTPPPDRLPDGAVEELPGGYRRQVTARPWRPGLELLTVSVVLPDGRRLDVNGLTPSPPPGAPSPAAPRPAPNTPPDASW